jgi:serine/threonine protein kinase
LRCARSPRKRSVYRAEDSALGRKVAIKVLPPAFVADAELAARFEREARVLACIVLQRTTSPACTEGAN